MIRRRGGVRRTPGARMFEFARRLEMRNPPFHPDFLGWVISPSTPSPPPFAVSFGTIGV